MELSDLDLKIKRVNRTIAAAEQYTATRVRLKRAADNSALVGTRPVELFSAIQSEGIVYFGGGIPRSEMQFLMGAREAGFGTWALRASCLSCSPDLLSPWSARSKVS